MTALALQSDGKLVVAGSFTLIAGEARSRIARLNPDGSLDSSFNAGQLLAGSDIVQMLVQPDGKVLVRTTNNVTRLNSDGSHDTAFTPQISPIGEPSMMHLEADGGILVGGAHAVDSYFSAYVRLHAHGLLYREFTHILGRAYHATTQSNGSVLLSGTEFAFLPDDRTSQRRGMARIYQTGEFDSTFNAALNGRVDSLAVQRDGRILIVGSFTSAGGQARDRIARLHADGSLDSTFSAGTVTFTETDRLDGFFHKVVETPDARIVLSGRFVSIAGTARNGFARLMPNGVLDQSFKPAIDGSVNDIVIGPNGSLIVGGQFTFAGTTRMMNLAEIDDSTAPPTIQAAPQPVTSIAGDDVVLGVTASGNGLKYQWQLNGTDITGATGPTYTIPSVQRFHAGAYTVAISNSFSAVISAPATLTVNAAAPSASRLLNISNRGYCGPDDRVLVTGFVVSSEGPRTLLIRAVGPTLGNQFGVAGALADPQLAVFRREANGSDTLLFSNDDWAIQLNSATTAAVSASVGAFALPPTSKDAALVATLQPGAYTVVTRGPGNTSGTVLVEVYEAL